MRKPWAVAVDLVLVVVFAMIGRASHAEALSLGGIAATAWPFLVGCLVGWGIVWALLRSSRLWGRSWVLEGVVVWVASAAGGLLLRVVTGGTAAVAFIMVATVTLGVLLLGWRVIDRLLQRRRTGSARG